MFLLGGVFRCVVDRAIISFMGGLTAYHMTRLVTSSVGGLSVSFMGGPVTVLMARPVTFSVGGLGVYLGAGTVQVECMFGCVVGVVITYFKGVLAMFYSGQCLCLLPPPHPGWAPLGSVRLCRR